VADRIERLSDATAPAVAIVTTCIAIAVTCAVLIVISNSAMSGAPIAFSKGIDSAQCGLTDSACFDRAQIHEYRWQGIWAMCSALFAFLALAGTAIGLFFVKQNVDMSRQERQQADAARKQEYRGYIQFQINRIEARADDLHAPAIQIRNYGRTPVTNLRGRINFEVWRATGHGTRVGIAAAGQPVDFNRKIHPDEWRELEVFTWFVLAPDQHQDDDTNLFLTARIWGVSYTDAFDEQQVDEIALICDFRILHADGVYMFEPWRGGVLTVLPQ
jgi:hypothetical protein